MKWFSTLTLICSLAFLPFALKGQQASEGSYPFMKKESGNGLSMVLQGQPKNVEAVLDEKLKDGTGIKGRKRSGNRAYENARYRKISPESLDIFYRVERASRGDKTNSRVFLFLSSGNNNFLDSKTYPDEIASAKEFLAGLPLAVEIYEMGLVIENQQKVIEKEIKRHEQMVKDSISLEAKLAETIQAIENNKQDRGNQLDKIANERARMEEFREKLKGLKGGRKADDLIIDEKLEIEDVGENAEGDGGK